MSNIEDIGKYQKALSEISAKLQELDEQRTRLLRQGMRIEGILAYLNGKEQERLAMEQEKAAPQPEAPAAAPAPEPAA